MSLIVATLVGGLFALGVFLMLRDNVIRVVWGIAMVSQAANVYLLSMGGLAEATHDSVPVLGGHGAETPVTADPVVQALVLTAIVIGFGTTALALMLTYRSYQENDSMNVQEWQ